ncbi:hypothetical protein B0T19DRAFT_452568 [Cercophora scortea]|uniref:Uncharacterized protein n=1 Tax=Cercophora scortea TaxID=314031 RepID=A0AAE0J2H6_9PEZI|nr:hypothetical protein B0T19DRAFT_452568 [Cercophora scortea]
MAPADPSSQILSGRITKPGPRTPVKKPSSSLAAAASTSAGARSSPKYGWCPDCRFGTRQRRLCDPEGKYPGKWSFVCSNKNKGCRFWELLADDPMLTLPPAPSRKPVCPQCHRGSLVEKCKDVFNFKDRYVECTRWREAERPCDYRRELPRGDRAGTGTGTRGGLVPFALSLRREREAAAVPAEYEEPVVDLTEDVAVPAVATRGVEDPVAPAAAEAPIVDLTDETPPPPSSAQESDYGSDFWNRLSSQPPEREEAAGSPATLGREEDTATQYSDLDPLEESLLIEIADGIERSAMASATKPSTMGRCGCGNVLVAAAEAEAEASGGKCVRGDCRVLRDLGPAAFPSSLEEGEESDRDNSPTPSFGGREEERRRRRRRRRRLSVRLGKRPAEGRRAGAGVAASASASAVVMGEERRVVIELD